jgi:hypothetical protein
VINDPAVVAEVTACFVAYDAALLANDVAALDGWFWRDAIRYGIGDEQYGAAAIAEHRRTLPAGITRPAFRHRAVTTFDRTTATVAAEWHEGDTVGRQTQTWIRTDDGWRIVCAHVSLRPAA